MKKIPYRDDQLAQFAQRSGNIRLVFETDKGRQVAFYLPPLVNPAREPERIFILYPGINSVALDWLEYIRLEDDPGAGYLLIDYPGRGLCEGMMHPEENYRNSEGALAALAAHFGIKDIQAELSLMGHSFGAGAALQFALQRPVRRIVLVAPYDTLSRAVALKSKIMGLLLPARIDNRVQIRTLLARPDAPEITIIHGREDDTLPVAMGRALAAIDPQRITYHEIPEGNHTSVLTTHRDLIFHTLAGKVSAEDVARRDDGSEAQRVGRKVH